MSLISSTIAKGNHNISVEGFNSRVVGSTVPFHTVYFTVTDTNKWHYEKGYKKEYSRKIVRKDGKIYYRYGGYKYDLSEQGDLD